MEPIRITQLSDTHLGQKPGCELLGMDTDYSLEQVLKLVSMSGDKTPSLLLLSGDISNNGYREAYERIYRRLDGCENVVWLPGNHDDLSAMEATCGGRWLRRRVDLGAWQLLCLDSSVAGTPRGTLGADQLDFLASELRAHPDQFTLVALHHHVLPVGSSWLDEQVLSNREELLALLGRYPNVRAVTSGHVHQPSDVARDEIRFLTVPSTCVQFAPNSRDFLVSDEAPGSLLSLQTQLR